MLTGVREAAVVATEHPMLDEGPVVFVIPQDGVVKVQPSLHEDILTACKDASAGFKMPCEARLVGELPRHTRKVAKAELRNCCTTSRSASSARTKPLLQQSPLPGGSQSAKWKPDAAVPQLNRALPFEGKSPFESVRVRQQLQ